MRTVIACMDDSAAAEPVLTAALATAPLFGAEVLAVHVADGGGDTAGRVAGSHRVPLSERHGDVLEQLVDAASGADVVALVIGARRRPTGPRSSGPLVRELVDRVEIPVLVVPPEAKVPDRISKVLMAMKGTPRNAKHLRRAVELVALAAIDLVVLHVDDERSIPSFSDQFQYDVEVYANEFLARYVPGVGDARLELRIGDPAEEILRAVESTGVHVVAAGCSRGVPRPGEDVAAALLARSHVPVLLVPLL